MGNPVTHTICNYRHDCRAVTMSHQNDIAQILILKHIHHILNVSLKPHFTGQEMSKLATACERRRVCLMSGGA